MREAQCATRRTAKKEKRCQMKTRNIDFKEIRFYMQFAILFACYVILLIMD